MYSRVVVVTSLFFFPLLFLVGVERMEFTDTERASHSASPYFLFDINLRTSHNVLFIAEIAYLAACLIIIPQVGE
jgi:hypothetical protein